METLEIIVYIVIAVIAGALLLGFYRQWDYRKTHEEVSKAVIDDKNYDIWTTKEEFTKELVKRWKACGFGELEKSYAIYIAENGTLEKDYVVERLIKYNNCDIIDCYNDYNDFIMNDITLPNLIIVRCSHNKLYVE